MTKPLTHAQPYPSPLDSKDAMPVFERYPAALNKAMRMIMIRLQVRVGVRCAWQAG